MKIFEHNGNLYNLDLVVRVGPALKPEKCSVYFVDGTSIDVPFTVEEMKKKL